MRAASSRAIGLLLLVCSVVLLLGAGGATEIPFPNLNDGYHFDRVIPPLQQPWYFLEPMGVASDAYGAVYLADTQHHRIQKLTADGHFITMWGSYGSGDGQFTGPTAVTVDGTGNVYVTDGSGEEDTPPGTGNDRVQKFLADGTFVDTWGRTGTQHGEFSNPLGIAEDGAGTVYVADSGNHRIQRFDADGAFLGAWGSLGSGGDQFNLPVGLAFDLEGNLLVADSENHRIQRLTPDGEWLGAWPVVVDSGNTPGSPHGLATDMWGNVYVTDPAHQCLVKLDADGGVVAVWRGGDGIGPTSFSPYGIAVNLRGNVFVTDLVSDCVYKFTPRGWLLNRWASFGDEEGQLREPAGTAMDADAELLYVVDRGNDRIQVFGLDGGPLRTWGAYGVGQGEFHRPVGIALAPDGRVFVTDTMNHRVQVFTAEGAFVTEFGGQGTDAGQFDQPHGIAVDGSGKVYVVDRNNHRVQQCSFDGAQWECISYGGEGSGNGQFAFPVGIAIKDSRVYVADTGNQRIQELGLDGSYANQWGTAGTGDGEFAEPWGIAVDADGNIYVADRGNHRFQKFTADGAFIGAWGSQGTDPGQMNFPEALAVSAGDIVAVADSGNHRVEVFKQTSILEFLARNKAIVVLGTGIAQNRGFSDATRMCAHVIRRALLHQGFPKGRLRVLMPDTAMDLDNNGVLDDVAGAATKANLEEALTNWASNAIHVVLCLIGPGGDGVFHLNETESLTATELAAWLDILQSAIPGAVIVVLDANRSETMLPALMNSSSPRLVISSAGADERAYFAFQGVLSFSYFFWTRLYGGTRFNAAFDVVRAVFHDKVNFQTPVWQTNISLSEKLDILSVLSVVNELTSGALLADALPVIGETPPRQVLGGDQNIAMFSLRQILDERPRLARVWAVVTRRPPADAAKEDEPVTEVSSFEMTPEEDGSYSGDYDQFDEPGEYQIDVYAMDSGLNVSEPTQTWVTKSALFPASLVGTVTDATTGGAIAGAEVAITEVIGMTVSTDASGAFVFAAVAPGSYHVRASANGYVSQAKPVTLTSGEMASLDFALTLTAVEGEGEGEGCGCFGAISGQSGGGPDGNAGDILAFASAWCFLILLRNRTCRRIPVLPALL